MEMERLTRFLCIQRIILFDSRFGNGWMYRKIILHSGVGVRVILRHGLDISVDIPAHICAMRK